MKEQLPMKILIITEGSRNIGFGHITRCLSLYQGFKEKKIDVEIVVNGDETIDFLLKRIKHKKLNWLKNRKDIYKQLKDADIAVIDSYLADLDFYKRVFETVRIPVYIDDYKRLDYPQGIVINSFIYGDRLKYPEKKGIKYLLGKDYIILRKEFWQVPEKKINKETRNVLITFGGMNHQGLAKKIINNLKSNFNFNFYIVDPSKNFSAKKMLSLMLKADICISGGGQTTYELVRVGVPTIGICFAKNQLFNLKYGEKAGYLRFASWFNSINLYNKIARTIKVLNYEGRLKMTKNGKKFVNGEGVKRIINQLIDKSNNI